MKREELFAAMTLGALKVDFGDEILLTIKIHSGLRSIRAERIAYCEGRRHTAVYALTDGEIVETISFPGSLPRISRRCSATAAFSPRMLSLQ